MLDKAIRGGRERRAPYRGSKRFDRTCRNHGSCKYCWRNRNLVTQRLRAWANLD